MKSRKVYPDGTFHWKNRQIFISKALGGERIGLEPVEERYWDVRFMSFVLGRLDTHTLALQPTAAAEQK